MGIVKTQLVISKEVAAQTEECVTFIPPSGEFFVTHFIGEAAFDTNCAVKVVWDSDGTPEILFSTKGSTIADLDISRIGDGVKKLALCLDNGLLGPVVMSGIVDVRQEV